MRLTLLSLFLFCNGMVTASMDMDDLPSLPDGGKIWVLLVAGSRGYYNYRHQADICHAYHIVSSHGIPDENIVVMMFDDIANAKENPIPGQIFNRFVLLVLSSLIQKKFLISNTLLVSVFTL